MSIMAKFKKTHDSDLCILPMAEREKEIADASARTMVLSEQIASAPPGVDVSELRHQLAMLSGKMGRHARASDNWGTPEELAESIAKYFDSRQVIVTDEEGNVLGYRQTQPITITGLANHLGVSRKTLVRYSDNNDEYGPIIAAARQKIEEMYEGRLVYSERAPVGAIFALKNLGWSDNVTIETDTEERRMTSEEIAKAISEDIV